MKEKNIPLEHSRKQILQRNIAAYCLVRLIFLSLLLIPLFLTGLWEDPFQGIFVHLSPGIYGSLIAIGFFLNIVYLIFRKRIEDITLLLRLQLKTDFVLSLFLIFLTGGINSGFVFLLFALTFLYGRTLGFRTSVWFAFSTLISLVIIGIIQHILPQYWNMPPLEPPQLGYALVLHVLAIGLILFLIFLGQGQEKRLVQDLEDKSFALKQAEALKTMVFDWMESGLLVLDDNGRISAINKQAGDWMDLEDPTSAIGKYLNDFFPSMAKAWKDHKDVPSYRLEVLEKESSVLFGLRITPLPDQQGSLVLFSDITPVRRLEKKLQQMEKLAAVGELAAGLAHEMKNPLAGIKTSLQLLISDEVEPDIAKRLNKVIVRDIDRLDNLLKNFLEFARPSDAVPSTIALDTLIKECLATLSLQYPHITIDVHESLHGIEWSWDSLQFMQVLRNLLINGLQAMEETDDATMKISLDTYDDGQVLVIGDNGPGITEDAIDRLFDPFFTTKAAGSGLGLSIAQRLAGQNNSWIEIQNTEPRGVEAKIHYQSIPPEDS